ncbi:MAG TPA: hypothetical protein H9716_03120 [Candidatus Enterocloster faecavium]|uniref:Uncharacterized protein n=1 Tax=Candidatus Enterocloster faecavium TaxID=2838560 RepID=A0A9D2L6E3_9FIRM|nr:hypothetical protein [Candidatus Enterocloster faecavium]
MMKLPSIRPLDPDILKMLESSSRQGTIPLIQMPEKEGLTRPYFCPSLTALDHNLLVFGLPQERTPLGRGLVRGLWFGRPGKLWLSSPGQTSLSLDVLPFRCLLAGPVFARLLNQARSEDPAADFGSVWELTVLDFEETDCVPEGIPQEAPDGEPEFHLDHPSLLARTPIKY